jgi:hypothetical protein
MYYISSNTRRIWYFDQAEAIAKARSEYKVIQEVVQVMVEAIGAVYGRGIVRQADPG